MIYQLFEDVSSSNYIFSYLGCTSFPFELPVLRITPDQPGSEIKVLLFQGTHYR